MANRSAAQRLPSSGFMAIRCAVMSQQLLPSSHRGPSSGGEMTAGRWLEGVTGAMSSSVMVAGNSGGIGLARSTMMVCDSSVGTGAERSSTTSSHTMPACPGPNVVVGTVPTPRARVQYRSPSPVSASTSLPPALTDNDFSVTSPPRLLVTCSSYARCTLPSVAGTGTGAATTLAITGVACTGPEVADVADVAGVLDV